ncbi:hypothetical protein Tco_1446913 [Tanacetum coccineum]
MWGTLQRLKKDRMSEVNFLYPAFCFVKKVDPYIIYLIVVEEEDGEWICFLGGNSSSGIKKYRGSNSSDGGNIGDGVKIAGEVIGSGDEIGSLRANDCCYDAKRPGKDMCGSYRVMWKGYGMSKEGYGARWRIAIDRLRELVYFSYVGGSGRDVKKAKGGTNFVAAAPSREGPGHFVRDCRSPAIPAAPVNAVDARPNQRACYECGDPNHL